MGLSGPSRIEQRLVGNRVDRFQILGALQSDGLVDSWAAVHDGGLEVVLKTIRPELVDDQQVQRAFTEELSLATRLDHPGVARIIELGPTFVAYEATRGKSLREIGEQAAQVGRPLPAWFGLRVIAAAARSLQHVHGLSDARREPLGILHQGLRPELIQVSGLGKVTLLELGLARAAALAPGAWTDGRLAYLAPEQARGAKTDRRSDLYSLGLCLYELLTGVQPFRAGSDREVLHQVLAGNPTPPRQLVPSLPASVEALLLRVLSLDPRARHPDAAFFCAELSTLLEADAHRERDLGRLLEELFPEEPVEVPDEPEPIWSDRSVSQDELTPVHLVRSPRLRSSRSALTAAATPPPELRLVVDRSEDWVPGASRPRPTNDVARAAAERFDRGLALLLGGRYDAALVEWESAVALTPSNRLYQSNLVRLRQLGTRGR